MEIGEILKDCDEVKDVERIVDDIYDKREVGITPPFIAFVASSGKGKSQMAFNLMRRGRKVIYLVASEDALAANPQSIYNAYREASLQFLKAAGRDKEENDGNLPYYTLALLESILRGQMHRTLRSLNAKDAMALLNELRENRTIIFLDEFPSHGPTSNSSPHSTARFYRKIFRSHNLVVVTASTNSVATNLINQRNLSRDSDARRVWCYVFTALPKMKLDHVACLHETFSWLKPILENSRPWFASLAIDYLNQLQKNLPDNISHIEILESIIKSIFETVLSSSKARRPYFFFGQLCMLLATSFPEVSGEAKSGELNSLINNHFAQLNEPKCFELTARETLFKPNTPKPWVPVARYPPVSSDILLYLSLSGCNDLNPLRNANYDRQSFITALNEAEKMITIQFNFANPDQRSNSGMKLEASTVGSFVLASHRGGLGGIKFEPFLCQLLYELNVTDIVIPPFNEIEKEIKHIFENVSVPFLAPPNCQWPETLSYPNLGVINRTMNEDRIDFTVGKDITGECKDYGRDLDLGTLKKIFERRPVTSKIHLVITNSIQQRYFQRNNVYGDFVKIVPTMQKTRVYRIHKNSMTHIDGIPNICYCLEKSHSLCKPVSIVIFIELKRVSEVLTEKSETRMDKVETSVSKRKNEGKKPRKRPKTK